MSLLAFERSRSIACIGECMIELSGQRFGNVKQSWGGDSYNTAVYLRRLLPDSFSVHYITALGLDPLSESLLQSWQAEGLDTSNVVRIADKVPGLYQISVDETGERSFTYWRNDSAAKYVFDNLTVTELVQKLSQFNWVYLSGISLAILTQQGRTTLIEALNEYHREGGQVIFDNNYRPALWQTKSLSRKAYSDVLAIANLALLTLDDERSHFDLGVAETVLSHWVCPEIVIKRGQDPCVIQSENLVVEVGAVSVDQVVDTTAAGDSFAAGYIAGRITGSTISDAAKLAHDLASTVIQFPGAIIPATAMAHLTLEEPVT